MTVSLVPRTLGLLVKPRSHCPTLFSVSMAPLYSDLQDLEESHPEELQSRFMAIVAHPHNYGNTERQNSEERVQIQG